MIARPQDVVDKGWIILSPYSKIQQSGIDVSLNFLQSINKSPINCVKGGFCIESRQSYEFFCHEYIKVPRDYIALVTVRSTFNRQGAFVTTGIYDNGYQNYIGGVLHNMMMPLFIKQNERIAQVVFLKSEATAQYNGKYQDRNKR